MYVRRHVHVFTCGAVNSTYSIRYAKVCLFGGFLSERSIAQAPVEVQSAVNVRNLQHGSFCQSARPDSANFRQQHADSSGFLIHLCVAAARQAISYLSKPGSFTAPVAIQNSKTHLNAFCYSQLEPFS
ncbi:hypothetical protein TGMAS_291970 [Toxoplasma gondii MAS]|uniref:Uncharacterized protein n=2 Tax=Toxoplasma gondii TaxID=5811 RepID=A0A086PZU0_TOXGO|nr:hypothetical protein TGMAS_291970 [Toxoplasma gondii MAS]PUA90352.1 hypothetical protein TGBR9_291970 [Toxoplasma gondii TgCATBr9]